MNPLDDRVTLSQHPDTQLSERGFSLLEVFYTMALMGSVLMGVFTLLQSLQKSETFGMSRYLDFISMENAARLEDFARSGSDVFEPSRSDKGHLPKDWIMISPVRKNSEEATEVLYVYHPAL